MSTHNFCFYGESTKTSINNHQLPSLSGLLYFHLFLLMSACCYFLFRFSQFMAYQYMVFETASLKVVCSYFFFQIFVIEVYFEHDVNVIFHTE